MPGNAVAASRLNSEDPSKGLNTRASRTVLGVILLVSVLARVAAALYLGNDVVDMPGISDQVSYHNLALRILDGHGFTFGEPWWPATPAGEPTAHWSYLYTGYLVLVYSLLGPAPLAARILQAVLVGVLQPLLVYLLARRVFGPVVGLVSAGIIAIYAYFIYYTASLMTESFYITTILLSLYLAMRIADGQERPARGQGRPPGESQVEHPGFRLAILLGLSLGAAILLRQLFLLFVPFIFLWLLLGRRRTFWPLVVSGAIILLMILPFTVFNWTRFDRFVMLNTNAGFAFFWGNHPVYGTHFQSILPSEAYYEMIPDELLDLDEAALDQALLRRGIQFILDDPVRYIQLSISRIPAYFMFWPSADSSRISNLARVASFGVFWPFMLIGLILSMLQRPSPFRLRPASPVLLLYVFVLVYTGIHILTWTLVRYRLPVDAVLMLFAGLAVVHLAERVPVLRRWITSFA